MTPDLQPLIKAVYALEPIVGSIAHGEFEPWLQSNINGDELISSLAISATVGKNKVILTYILTTTKLVKVTIDEKEFSASSVYLNKVISVSRTVRSEGEGNNAHVAVEFPDGRFSLSYRAEKKEIDTFFEKVDQEVQRIKNC